MNINECKAAIKRRQKREPEKIYGKKWKKNTSTQEKEEKEKNNKGERTKVVGEEYNMKRGNS